MLCRFKLALKAAGANVKATTKFTTSERLDHFTPRFLRSQSFATFRIFLQLVCRECSAVFLLQRPQRHQTQVSFELDVSSGAVSGFFVLRAGFRKIHNFIGVLSSCLSSSFSLLLFTQSLPRPHLHRMCLVWRVCVKRRCIAPRLDCPSLPWSPLRNDSLKPNNSRSVARSH